MPRRPAHRQALPETLVVEVTGADRDGDALARPVEWAGKGRPPVIVMLPEPRGQAALARGQRVLARIRRAGRHYEGRTLRRLEAGPARILGVLQGDRLVPTDRRARMEWTVAPRDAAGAAEGEIVLAEALPATRLGLAPARVVERLGRLGDARAVSLIVIHTHAIPTDFAADALEEAARARAATPRGREDLRDIPLVTIDGEDARDFDDAVFAAPDAGGHRLVVAIADVAHYVRPGSALDREARQRGNSCYFPDRVVPMLPEALSNGWCSLRPAEDRGCLFAEMRIDAQGNKLSHRFGRGLMRSAARLTYEQVQQAHDTSGAHAPLYAAFRALLAARQARGTLDLDLPERRVVLDAAGQVAAVAPRPRLDSHRLIEEFMVLANVAAAEELERLRAPCVYRVHAPPSDEKRAWLRDFLRTLPGNLATALPPGAALHPRDLDRVLRRVAGTELAPLVNETVLRSQSQAAYAPDNIGHFGLALPRYAHFTSPIRRYADLLVHRALVRALRLGPGGMEAEEAAALEATAAHVTATERRAQLAERDAVDRYLAAYMAHQTGTVFAARISGVTRFGLFVTVTESGASGLVPVSSLQDDFWFHDEAAQTLTGRRTRTVFRLAGTVQARLVEASPVTGGLIFHVVQPSRGAPPRARPDRGADKRAR